MPLEALRVRQQYRQYTLAALAELVVQTLEGRDETPDPAWRGWLTHYCLYELRPHTLDVTPKDWCRWIAFSLRYLQPLLTSSPPIETKPVIEVMRKRPEVIQTLMFGTSDTLPLALHSAYEIHADYRSQVTAPDLRPDQHELFQRVMRDMQTADARTLTGWSRYYLDAKGQTLPDRIYGSFHSVLHPTLSGVVQIIGDTRKSETEARVKFEAYLNRALQEHADTGLAGQTLGYLNEYERRQNMILTYSRLFRRAAVVLGLCFVFGVGTVKLSVGVVGDLVAGLCFGLGIFGMLVIGLLIPVIFLNAFENYSSTKTSLETLEMLMGPMETREGANPESS